LRPILCRDEFARAARRKAHAPARTLATRRWALIVIKMALPLIGLIAVGATYPPKVTAVAVLPPGRAMNSAITTVIVTANPRPITTGNAGPRDGVPARVLNASQASARDSKSIRAIQTKPPPQARGFRRRRHPGIRGGIWPAAPGAPRHPRDPRENVTAGPTFSGDCRIARSADRRTGRGRS